jgi:hypothetical protein
VALFKKYSNAVASGTDQEEEVEEGKPATTTTSTFSSTGYSNADRTRDSDNENAEEKDEGAKTTSEVSKHPPPPKGMSRVMWARIRGWKHQQRLAPQSRNGNTWVEKQHK